MDKEEEKGFQQLISEFNKMYNLPLNEKPTLLGIERLENFKKVLLEEVHEVDEIIARYREVEKDLSLSEDRRIEILTAISDWLGDMIVYITSEAVKYGLDIDETLKIIMQSNFSKLGADGKPIYDERGKVMKGPNYWKPEPKISEYLKEKLKS
ncbi:MAG: pyrophosphatase [Candidatus Pacearchaeota archaeon]